MDALYDFSLCRKNFLSARAQPTRALRLGLWLFRRLFNWLFDWLRHSCRFGLGRLSL
jgi:hypothetical protein